MIRFLTGADRPRSLYHRFTLIELLVVIAVISVLAAILLPSLNLAKQQAEFTTCGSNLRQYGMLAAMWQDDKQALMPAWYYRNHPDGKSADEDVYTAAGQPWNIDPAYSTAAPIMLADEGYADRGMVQSTSTSKENLDRAGRETMFVCPSSFTPTWNVSNNRYWDAQGAGVNNPMPLEQAQRRNQWVDRNGSLTGIDCPFCETGQTRGNRSSYGRMITSYGVNMSAGSYHWYHGNTKYNRGYYKQNRWRTSDPSKIGYIFESNMAVTGNNHYTDMFSTSLNSWALGGLRWGPPTRHLNMKKANFVYADGHRGTLGDHYRDPYNPEPFPFVWY